MNVARVQANEAMVLAVFAILLAVLALVFAGGSFYDAVLYALAAVSTGGFAPRGGSLAGAPGLAFNITATGALCWPTSKTDWRRATRWLSLRTANP